MKNTIRLVDINKVKDKLFARRQETFTRNELEFFFSKKEAPTININDIWPTAK